jgi:hypothetical protein
MAYIGIGYSGNDNEFLKIFVEQHMEWLQGDRLPKFFGNGFLILYDSNTAREFAQKCIQAAPLDTISIFPMEKPLDTKKTRIHDTIQRQV